jgi:cobalt-zinc-cadmium efflux system membrane fusion protein
MKIVTLVMSLAVLMAGCGSGQHNSHEDEHGHEAEAAELERGPHGGRLLEDGGYAVELAIFETGVPPEYRVWLYRDGKLAGTEAANVMVRLTRLDGEVNEFTFTPEAEFLRGEGVVEEPHSFDVEVNARWSDRPASQWKFSSYEGRTMIPAATADAMGVTVQPAAAGVLREQVALSGVVQADPARISRVRARYAGVIRDVAAEPGQTVVRGALLAQVQSNESLQSYAVAAPIAGTIVEHRAQVGEATGEEPLFTLVDVSQVWIELDVFQNDLSRIEVGQSVDVIDLNGERVATGRIGRVAPLAMHGSQSVRARAVLDNASGALRPGQFVTGRVTAAETKVGLAVLRKALQRFRDFEVVFERVGDTYEVRMLELGRADGEYVEVLGGLKPGAQYVVDNSYLIKADIEKSGASHDH